MAQPRQAAQPGVNGRRPRRSPRSFTIHVDPALCKSCGICTKLCPKQVFEAGAGSAPPSVARPSDCTGCRFCELHCPDAAIEVLGGAPDDGTSCEEAAGVPVTAGPPPDDHAGE